MSRDIKKKKKSTSKYRKFKVSPLIPIIAMIEVLVLIAISSYAWFIVAQDKYANTGVITVDADSGLNIDFKNASYEDEINLWEYVADDFEFSPVTSLDGRNVFVPTSGTFGNDSTNNIVFRDATVNDINTKYIDVDFTLTNTNTTSVNVYLNNNSHFEVYDGNNKQSSRALRLAFYTNDAKHGNVGSSILANTNNENAALDALDNSVTVYFTKPDHWSTCYAYVWKNANNTVYNASAWPGSTMTHVAGKVYSYTFSYNEGYNHIIFSNGTDGSNRKVYGASGSTSSNYTQTRDLMIYTDDITESHIYEGSAIKDSKGTEYVTKTVYFRKPTDWGGVRAHAFVTPGNTSSFTTYPGDMCTYCGADIYSYTFPRYVSGNSGTQYNGIVFSNSSNSDNKTEDLPNATMRAISGYDIDGKLYYFNGGNNGACSGVEYTDSTIYFNNSVGWEKPYVKLTSPTGHVTRVAMTNLSANVYYASIPSAYTTISFEERKDMDNTTNQTGLNKYTQNVTYTDGYIYRPKDWTSTGYDFTSFSYTDTVGGSDTYAVISPGVSAGFQRAYTPVVGVSNDTGAPVQVVPAFASALDNYIKRSGREMFTIPAHGMLDLSMIIWLEGTDKDCTEETYAGKNIELYLEFSTTITEREGVDDADYYTYRFYDRTRECWTSDRITNDAGNSVAPVIQLYDATIGRGYLMHAASTTNINGTRKVDMWECQAPATLYTGSDNNNVSHDLYFRRVDPYNEDEVWNYWHPYSPKDSSGGTAFQSITENSVTTSYVSFTAFADGAPARSAEPGIEGNNNIMAAATSATAPTHSCGGLWGDIPTTTLTVVDGLPNNDTYHKSGAVMTLNYTMNGQNVEYRASGYDSGTIFYFVIPTAIYNSSSYTSFSFKNYYNYNDKYALNIYNRNSGMSYNKTYTINSQMTGKYAMIQRNDSDNGYSNYWGDSIFYYQIKQDQCFTDGAKAEVAFVGSGDKFYMRTGDNSVDSFTGGWGYYGFAVVVPKNATETYLHRWIYGGGDWYTTSNYTLSGGKRLIKITGWENGKLKYETYDSSWP